MVTLQWEDRATLRPPNWPFKIMAGVRSRLPRASGSGRLLSPRFKRSNISKWGQNGWTQERSKVNYQEKHWTTCYTNTGHSDLKKGLLIFLRLLLPTTTIITMITTITITQQQ